MKKKFTLLLLAALALTSCGNNSNNPHVDPNPDQPNGGETDNPGGGTEGGGTEGGGTEGGETEDKVPEYTLFSMSQKSSFTQFEKNSKNDKVFKKLDQTFKVGDDNAFNFSPSIKVKTKENKYEERKLPVAITLFVEEDAGEGSKKFTQCDETAYTKYVEAFDKVECNLSFTDAAVGHKFKLVYAPEEVDQTKTENAKFIKDFTFEVRNGVNINNAKELGYINNDPDNFPSFGKNNTPNNIKTEWKAFKKANNLDENLLAEGIYLQNDIVLDSTSIPADYFVDEKEVEGYANAEQFIGGLKDKSYIYRRLLNEGENFEMSGNYFKIDAREFPLVVAAGNEINDGETKVAFSHASMFKFEGKDKDNNVKVSDFNIIGNSPKVADNKLGLGLIFHKSTGVNSVLENINSGDFLITFFPDGSVKTTKSLYLVDSCIATNSYNTALYNYGHQEVTVKDSLLSNVGGPAIIQDHVNLDPSNPATSWTSQTKFVNSKIDNFVLGTEPWFEIQQISSQIGQLKVLGTAMAKYLHRTFIKGEEGKEKFNLIALNKPAGEDAKDVLNASKLALTRGELEIDGHVFNYGKDAWAGAGYIEYLTHLQKRDIVLETSTGGIAYQSNSEGFIDMTTGQPITPDSTFLTGDYLCIYFSGLQLLVDYFPVSK